MSKIGDVKCFLLGKAFSGLRFFCSSDSDGKCPDSASHRKEGMIDHFPSFYSFLWQTVPGSETPALSPKWVTQLGFIPFFPEDNGNPFSCPSFFINILDNETEVLDFLNKDVGTILGLPFHQFWSQVIHDSSLRDFVDMYLRYAKRKSDQWSKPQNEEIKRSQTQQELHHRVFLVIQRVTRIQESEEDFMSLSYFVQLNQKYTLFDVPKIFDICALYADYNFTEVKKNKF